MRKKSEKKAVRQTVALPIIGLIVLIIALIIVMVFLIIKLNTPKMQEINTDSNLIGVPMQRYFYNADGSCIAYDETLLRDGRLDAKNLSKEQKENIVTNFLISQNYSDYPFSYINEVYQIFFGKDENIEEKDAYETARGKISKNEHDAYTLVSKCGAPEIYTCVALDKAFKSEKNDIVKATVAAFTVTSENGNVYPGIERDGNVIGARSDFDVTEKMNDLPKWELTFKIDKSTGLYQLVSTSKIS